MSSRWIVKPLGLYSRKLLIVYCHVQKRPLCCGVINSKSEYTTCLSPKIHSRCQITIIIATLQMSDTLHHTYTPDTHTIATLQMSHTHHHSYNPDVRYPYHSYTPDTHTIATLQMSNTHHISYIQMSDTHHHSYTPDDHTHTPDVRLNMLTFLYHFGCHHFTSSYTKRPLTFKTQLGM